MIKKIKEHVIKERLNFKVRKIKGISKVISMSKIKKIKLIIKNWTLKGMWLLEIGSKPHSKGEDFSRSDNVVFDRIKFKNNIKEDNNQIIIKR